MKRRNLLALAAGATAAAVLGLKDHWSQYGTVIPFEDFKWTWEPAPMFGHKREHIPFVDGEIQYNCVGPYPESIKGDDRDYSVLCSVTGHDGKRVILETFPRKKQYSEMTFPMLNGQPASYYAWNIPIEEMTADLQRMAKLYLSQTIA